MENSKNIVRIAGDKVNLCILRTDEEAIAKYAKWVNDESINYYLSAHCKIFQFNGEIEWANKNRSENQFVFTIVDKHNDALLGTCELDIKEKSRTASLGILIGEKQGRGTGCGTEVISLLVKFAFEELNMHRVELEVMADNPRAIKCYEKVGFKHCGTKHEDKYHKGKYRDVMLMELLKYEYEINKTNKISNTKREEELNILMEELDNLRN